MRRMSRYAATLKRSEWQEFQSRLCTNLANARAAAQLAHKDIAQRMKCTVGTSIRWHAGRSQPSLHDLVALAKLYKVQVRELVA